MFFPELLLLQLGKHMVVGKDPYIVLSATVLDSLGQSVRFSW